MALLSALMGMINVASLIWILYKDQTGLSTVYLGTILFFMGITVQKLLQKGSK